jgi:predicted DNA-binding protein
MKRVNIHLSDKQIEALKALAKSTGLKVAEHVRRAIDKYLEDQKGK